MTRLMRSAPYFPVADVSATSKFYEEILGFQVEYIGGSPAEFAISSASAGFSS